MSTLDKSFTAVLNDARIGTAGPASSCPARPSTFGTRGLVRNRGSISGHHFRGSFMALGDGTRKLAVPANMRAHVGKDAGDTVSVQLDERIPPAPRRSTR